MLVARLMPNSRVFIRSFKFSVCNVDELIKAQEPEKYFSSQRTDIPRHYQSHIVLQRRKTNPKNEKRKKFFRGTVKIAFPNELLHFFAHVLRRSLRWAWKTAKQNTKKKNGKLCVNRNKRIKNIIYLFLYSTYTIQLIVSMPTLAQCAHFLCYLLLLLLRAISSMVLL